VSRVSVIVPTRGRSELLDAALHCALNQVGVDVEVIVVDDGSTDDTAASLARKNDERLRVLRNDTPQGVSAARNRGISHARSRWIAFLDDDDLWAPDKLAAQLHAVETTGRTWVYAGDVNIDSDLRVLSGAPPPDPDTVVRSLDRYNAVPSGASNVMVSSEELERVGTFDPGLTNNEDWDLWIRLARNGPPACVDRPLVAYTMHAEAASKNMERMLRELDIIAQRYGIGVDHAAHLRWAAWSHLLDGERKAAVRYYRQAAGRGDGLSLGRMLMALVVPSPAWRQLSRTRRRYGDASWNREAGEWLAALTTRRQDLADDPRTRLDGEIAP
jgi:glycosyltransferase involved in cell wall biosynthesis